MQALDLAISSLHAYYRDKKITPSAVVDYILAKCLQHHHHNIWIHLLSREQISPYLDRIKNASADDLPLYGIPFAIKDNIDLAGVPTTAGCPDYSYTPGQSAFVVEQLIEAGAIPVGKTNMDQFATGLTGTRSPYGAVNNSINPDYMSGGSSSGSAVATASGLVSFALGTDTAGSGRIPAMCNNLIGVKPSFGVVSTRGVVAACRSIDCVSLLALNPDDAACIYPVIARYDEQDSYARVQEPEAKPAGKSFRFGILAETQLQTGTPTGLKFQLEQMTEQLIRLGGTPVVIDFTPFQQAASLLYEGPWIAERYVTVESLLMTRPEALLPITRTIISKAENFDAVDAFRAMYRLRELKRMTDQQLYNVDFVVTPTATEIYTHAELEQDPTGLNTRLGFYTHFVNLLDYSAVALPAGRRDNGLPFGITLFADKFQDEYLIEMARRILAHSGLTMGATGISWAPSNIPAVEINKDRV